MVLNTTNKYITCMSNLQILPHTRVVSDMWRAYGGIHNLGRFYRHVSINHSLYFVDPNDPTVHTQTIEGFWSIAKAKYRSMRGTSLKLFPTYLDELMWRRTYNDNPFMEMLYWIRFYYWHVYWNVSVQTEFFGHYGQEQYLDV